MANFATTKHAKSMHSAAVKARHFKVGVKAAVLIKASHVILAVNA